jgi:hypothetical protein
MEEWKNGRMEAPSSLCPIIKIIILGSSNKIVIPTEAYPDFLPRGSPDHICGFP